MSSHYRRDDLAYGDDHGGPPQRWDRSRFERARNGGSREIDIDFHEYDRRNGPRRSESREFEFDERFSRGPAPAKTRYYDDDRRSEFILREQETTGREMAPYRSRDRIPPPGYARRRHEPDDDDRRSHFDDERDINVSVNIDNHDRHGPPSMSRDRFQEEDDRYYRDQYEDDRRVKIEREREIWRRGGQGWEERDREEYYERDSPPPRPKERRGKTKMPKRLCHKRAIVELGFPFVEEEHFYWIQTPLDQDRIDEVLRISDVFFKDEIEFSRRTETKLLEAPEPPKAPEPAPIETTTTKTTTTIIENPTDEDIARLRREAENAAENNDDDDNDGDDDNNDNEETETKDVVENASITSNHGTKRDDTKSIHESVHESTHKSNNGKDDDESIDESVSIHERKTSHGRNLSVHESTHEHRSRERHRGRSKSTHRRPHHHHHHHHHRSKSGYRREEDLLVFEESASIGLGPIGALAIRDKSRRRSQAARERDIKAEIKELELEKVRVRGRHKEKERSGEWQEIVKFERGKSKSRLSSSSSSSSDFDEPGPTIANAEKVLTVKKNGRGQLSLVRRT